MDSRAKLPETCSICSAVLLTLTCSANHVGQRGHIGGYKQTYATHHYIGGQATAPPEAPSSLHVSDVGGVGQ